MVILHAVFLFGYCVKIYIFFHIMLILRLFLGALYLHTFYSIIDITEYQNLQQAKDSSLYSHAVLGDH